MQVQYNHTYTLGQPFEPVKSLKNERPTSQPESMRIDGLLNERRPSETDVYPRQSSHTGCVAGDRSSIYGYSNFQHGNYAAHNYNMNNALSIYPQLAQAAYAAPLQSNYDGQDSKQPKIGRVRGGNENKDEDAAKKFFCNSPGCEKGFARRSDLVRHGKSVMDQLGASTD